MKKIRIRIKFVKQDCWIGVYWRNVKGIPDGMHQRKNRWLDTTEVYVCLVPCFPIILLRTRRYFR